MAGWLDVGPARRFANALQVIKTVQCADRHPRGRGPADSVSNHQAGIGVGTLAANAVVALSVYVSFGWLEHTLRMPIGIAHNEAESAGLNSDDFGTHDATTAG